MFIIDIDDSFRACASRPNKFQPWNRWIQDHLRHQCYKSSALRRDLLQHRQTNRRANPFQLPLSQERQALQLSWYTRRRSSTQTISRTHRLPRPSLGHHARKADWQCGCAGRRPCEKVFPDPSVVTGVDIETWLRKVLLVRAMFFPCGQSSVVVAPLDGVIHDCQCP
jgi:hypothetical protein